jgi:hypothetical protein
LLDARCDRIVKALQIGHARLLADEIAFLRRVQLSPGFKIGFQIGKLGGKCLRAHGHSSQSGRFDHAGANSMIDDRVHHRCLVAAEQLVVNYA